MAGTPVRRRSAELVTLRTDDGWELDAVLYPAQTQAGAKVVLLHLHGKGATMLDIHARWLPDQLPGVAHLALNMRCHALAYNTDRDDVPVAGGMYETLADGEVDIHAAVEFLRSEGFTHIVMSGHSSGGYYAGVYTPEGEDIVGRVLLSPLTDNKTALSWWWPEAGGLEAALERAHGLLAAGRPDEIIPLSSWYWGISARSLIERAAQSGDLWLRRVNTLTSPVLLGWGGTESRDALWAEVFEEIAAESKTKLRLAGSDHWYHGFEGEVAAAVASFVCEVTGVDPR